VGEAERLSAGGALGDADSTSSPLPPRAGRWGGTREGATSSGEELRGGLAWAWVTAGRISGKASAPA
jgi:hypothetical protein